MRPVIIAASSAESSAASKASGIEEKLQRAIESGDVDLPVLPAVGSRVIQLVNNEKSNAQDLARLIQDDQALAGHVMRMANSAAYSGFGKIQTLQQGIANLGIRVLGQMVLTVSVGQSILEGDAATRERAKALWQHALASAAWSREIARIARSNTELAYLSGLLHQMGKAVVLRTLNRLQGQPDGSISEPEREDLLQRYHRVLGISLARRWQLPEAVVETINYIDDYYGAPGARATVMAVNGGRTLADLTIEGDRDDIEAACGEEKIFRDLNFYEEDLARLAGQAEAIQSLLADMTL